MTRKRSIFVSSAIVLGLSGATGDVGLVLAGNAHFARTYVRDQLRQQHIQFRSLGMLTPDERRSPCLVTNAGLVITTGKQAECYANEFIARHTRTVAGGKTYADMGEEFLSLTSQVETARASNDPAVADLQKQLAMVTALRGTLFQGETSRGLLLTAFGFSDLGAKAGQAAAVAYTASGLLAILSLALLVVARRSPGAPLTEADVTRDRPMEDVGVGAHRSEAAAHEGREDGIHGGIASSTGARLSSLR